MRDRDFFQKVSRDYARFVGDDEEGETFLHYYVLKPGKWNPVHRESEKPSYMAPFALSVSFLFEEAESQNVDADEGGLVESEFDAEAAIPYSLWAELTEGPKAPKIGDVICQHPLSERPRWFRIVKVDEFGIVRNGPGFTEWKIALKSRSGLTEEVLPAEALPLRPSAPSEGFIAPRDSIPRLKK